MSSSGRRSLLIVLLAVGTMSWVARTVHHQRVSLPGHESWITSDADTLYQLRRVQRVMSEGLPVASTDSYLNYPHGSAIPWPPYYTLVGWALTAPLAPPGGEELRGWIERRMSSLPMLFGIATTLLAALAARALAGNSAALIAGGVHALCMGSVAYSKSGNGDHHAWITMLTGAMLWILSASLGKAGLTARQGAVRGAAAGAIAGVALGSWVASLLYVLPVQLTLGWWVWLHSRRANAGVPAFGLSFHGAALLVLLPAVLSSPWRESNPWMVVNLSWFHAAWLLLGAGVFVPLLFLRSGPRLRAYPLIGAAALAGVAAFLLTSGAAPAVAVREGFSWMSRENDFMASVWESRGLVGRGAAFDPFAVLGWGVLALPFAWAWAAWRAFRNGRTSLLPWVVTVPLLALQAARQVRFADALSLPMAVTLGWAAVEAVRRHRRRFPGAVRRRAWIPWAAAALAVVAAQADTVALTVRAVARGAPGSPEHPSALAMREMCEWLRRETRPGDWSVLARWNWGHTVEWAADRPSVATNFGTYVGEDSFRDPSRLLLTEDPAVADSILEARRSRYVALTSWLPGTLRQMIRDVDPSLESRYLQPTPTDEARLRFEWFRTIGARLMYDGAVVTADRGPVGALDFVRLAYVSPRRDPRPGPRGEPGPAGWIWERVLGAAVRARGNPGDELRVSLRVRYPAGRYEAVWDFTAVCDDDGTARLRIPYATDAPNGDGVVTEAGWRLGDRHGDLTVPEAAVLRGLTVSL